MELRPGVLSGNISAPASKSDGQRAILCAALANGTSCINGLGASDDENAMLEIARALGRKVTIGNSATIISGELSISDELTLHAGESGLASRLIAGVAAAFDKQITITGEGSLLRRPMDFWLNTFPEFGIEIETENGLLPLKIHGPYRKLKAEVDGSHSSQYISGLLIGLAFSGKGFRIRVKNLVSAAYLRMTLQTLRRFGIDVSYSGEVYELVPDQRFQPVDYTVDTDWSSASFWLVAAALGHPLSVVGLNPKSLQADVAVLEALRLAGCQVVHENEVIRIKAGKLTAFQFNATDCPDLFPILAVLATQCTGTTILRGVHRLKNKESDRALAIQRELGKMGAEIVISGDEMRIPGPVKLGGANLDSHRDHRIAMSLAIASTVADRPCILAGAESVSKSYPGFWREFKEKLSR